MAHSEYKRIQLESTELLGCYTKHEATWRELALLADRHARDRLSDPLPDDVVDYLLPMLTVEQEFRRCLGGKLSAKKWYLYFAEYILHCQWSNILAARPA